MATQDFRPLTADAAFQVRCRRSTRSLKTQGRSRDKSPDSRVPRRSERRPQQQRPADLAPHRRRSQAEVSQGRFQAQETRRRGRGDRRSNTIRIAPRASLLIKYTRRREELHPRSGRSRQSGAKVIVWRSRASRARQCASAQRDSARREHSQYRDHAGPRRPDRAQRRPAGHAEQPRSRLRAGEAALGRDSPDSRELLTRRSARSATSIT